MAKKKKTDKQTDKGKIPWAKRANSTAGSIALGLGALTFAFALVYSDSISGGGSAVLQRLMIGSQGQNGGAQVQTAGGQGSAWPDFTAPGTGGRSDSSEIRMDAAQSNGIPAGGRAASLPSSGGNFRGAGEIRGDNANAPGSIESYLDNAWSNPPVQQGAPGGMQNFNSSGQTGQRMAFQGNNMGGFPQRGMGRPGTMLRGNLRGNFPVNAGFGGNQAFNTQGFGGNQNFGGNQGFAGGPMANNQGGKKKSLLQMLMGGGDDGNKNANSARGDVEYNLERARTCADQASTYMDRARDLENADEKREAASEARYYANEARVAADKAASRGSGISELQGLVSEARSQANRASSFAQYAADAASGW